MIAGSCDLAVALAGWVFAGIAVALAVTARRGRDARMEAVARACHELRGPLTAVRLGLSLSTRTGELGATRLRAIDTELRRATLALDDLAETRQRPVGEPRLRDAQDVPMSRLLADAVQAAAGRAAVAQTTVEGGWDGVEAIVWGERLRLAQAVGNLIANAIEHGGGAVRIRGGLRDGMARIEVADDGPGLPAPVAELARRPRAGRGTRGRGLAIALAVARAHGGTLGAAPVRGGGKVVLILPAFEATTVGRAKA